MGHRSSKHKHHRHLILYLASGIIVGVLGMWITREVLGHINRRELSDKEILEAFDKQAEKLPPEPRASDLDKLAGFVERFQTAPCHATLLFRLGGVCNRGGDPWRAAEVYKQLMAGYPDSPYYFEAVLGRAEVLHDVGDIKGACQVLAEGCLRLEGPQHSLAELRLFELVVEAGKVETVLDSLERALQRLGEGGGLTLTSPAAGRLYLLKAICLADGGQADLSREALELANAYCYDPILRRKIRDFESQPPRPVAPVVPAPPELIEPPMPPLPEGAP